MFKSCILVLPLLIAVGIVAQAQRLPTGTPSPNLCPNIVSGPAHDSGPVQFQQSSTDDDIGNLVYISLAPATLPSAFHVNYLTYPDGSELDLPELNHSRFRITDFDFCRLIHFTQLPPKIKEIVTLVEARR